MTITLEMMPPLMFGCMIVFLLIGFPVAFSLAAVGIDPTASGVAGLYRDLRVTWLPTDASPADVLAHA